MGPLTHGLTTKVIGAPLVAGWLPDVPVVLAKVAPSPVWQKRFYWLAEQTHGTPGAVVAALLGRRWLAAWALHVALDTISHHDGGATGKSRKVWLP